MTGGVGVPDNGDVMLQGGGGGYPDYDLVLMYWANRSLSEPWFTASAVAYSLLILVTFLGNSLVIWAVARRKELWSPRNIFILNLAVSDICKCPSAARSIPTYWVLLPAHLHSDGSNKNRVILNISILELTMYRRGCENSTS